MKNATVWKTRAAGLALLAVASGAALAQGTDADPQNRTAYRNLDGVWQCHFLKANGEIERNYYSMWIFKPDKPMVVVFWSPVHKGDAFSYRWDGKQLALDSPRNPPKPNYGIYKTQMQLGETLVIEDPRFRWKGWRCTRQPKERWPEDGLQFLDYAHYPWLSGLIEDGREIEKYRNAKR